MLTNSDITSDVINPIPIIPKNILDNNYEQHKEKLKADAVGNDGGNVVESASVIQNL